MKITRRQLRRLVETEIRVGEQFVDFGIMSDSKLSRLISKAEDELNSRRANKKREKLLARLKPIDIEEIQFFGAYHPADYLTPTLIKKFGGGFFQDSTGVYAKTKTGILYKWYSADQKWKEIKSK